MRTSTTFFSTVTRRPVPACRTVTALVYCQSPRRRTCQQSAQQATINLRSAAHSILMDAVGTAAATSWDRDHERSTSIKVAATPKWLRATNAALDQLSASGLLPWSFRVNALGLLDSVYHPAAGDGRSPSRQRQFALQITEIA